MKFKVISKTARSIVVELEHGEIYQTKTAYDIFINGEKATTSNRVITSLFGLKPGTTYEIWAEYEGEPSEKTAVTTEYEYVTCNVKTFGAKGDGKTDDTAFIQAAIMSCPKYGRILIPKGIYSISSLFLKSDIHIEIQKGVVLSAQTDRSKFPILKGLFESYDEKEEYNLGTWEGNPLDMFAGIITGIHVENVVIYGEGTVDGNASFENWWNNPKIMNVAFRPRLLFLNRCKNVTVQGIRFQNSPAWNIHPYFSEDLNFLDLSVRNPQNSPNTDGLDPESCKNVLIAGVEFSLGDDCIAVKSGKIYMGAKYKTPSENIVIRQCLMKNGHGAVTLGSEMAGGIKNLIVRDCLFKNTDRGLRMKTRRGRGEDAIVKDVLFERIKMDHVMTPFVVNSFYYCDPDGHSEYVRSKEKLPVDERTPYIESLEFQSITCENCHVAAGFFYGLPEKKIKYIKMKDVSFSYAKIAAKGVPAMLDGISPVRKMGLFANNVEELVLEAVTIKGADGEAFIIENVDQLHKNQCEESE